MKNRRDKFIVALGLIALLLLCLPASTHAQSVIDQSRQGSLTLRLKDVTSDAVVPGAEIQLYPLASLEASPGTPGFAWLELYRDLADAAAELSSASFAEQLAQRAVDQAEPLMQASTDAAGEVIFSDLDLGLYLLVQTGGPDTYYPMEPFLLALPLTNEAGTAWLYDVTAYPKVEARAEVTQPTKPSTPSEPAPPLPTQPGSPDDGGLIITGTSNWLVIALSVAGLSLIVLGWILLRQESRDAS